eukprot:2922156-Alexandrium_andersonii.AAC.1
MRHAPNVRRRRSSPGIDSPSAQPFPRAGTMSAAFLPRQWVHHPGAHAWEVCLDRARWCQTQGDGW